MPAGLALLGHADRSRSVPRCGVPRMAGPALRIRVRAGAVAGRRALARPPRTRAAGRAGRPSGFVRAQHLPLRIALDDRRRESRICGPWSAARPHARRRLHFSTGEIEMKFFSKLAVLAAVTLCAATTSAQTYPDKPVRVIVTTVPGPLDAFARVVMQQLERRLKQTFIVDNPAGAGGNLAADIAAKAPRLPPAPARLSTMKVCFSRLSSCC